MSDSQNQVRAAAANEFRRSPALQAEFTSEQAYAAYRCAMDRGAARIFGPAVPTKSYTAHSASGARVDAVSAAPGQPSMNIQVVRPGQPTMNIQVGRAVARDDREAIKSIVREFQQTHRPGSYRVDEVAAFIAERVGLTQAQAYYAHEQSVMSTSAVA